MPFGSLFEQMTGGAWTRSYASDPRTGDWADVSDVVPEPGCAARSRDEDRGSASQPTGAGRAPRRRPRPANPLATLLGGGLGGGMGGQGGNFEVQPPDGLTTFGEVGGREAIRQEARETVRLMLEHRDEAQRYGIAWNGILPHGPPGVGKTSSGRRWPASTTIAKVVWVLRNGLTPVEQAVKDTVRSDLVRRIRLRFRALMASVLAGEAERLSDVRAAHP